MSAPFADQPAAGLQAALGALAVARPGRFRSIVNAVIAVHRMNLKSGAAAATAKPPPRRFRAAANALIAMHRARAARARREHVARLAAPPPPGGAPANGPDRAAARKRPAGADAERTPTPRSTRCAPS
jgi:hypothetical protein